MSPQKHDSCNYLLIPALTLVTAMMTGRVPVPCKAVLFKEGRLPASCPTCPVARCFSDNAPLSFLCAFVHVHFLTWGDRNWQ